MKGGTMMMRRLLERVTYPLITLIFSLGLVLSGCLQPDAQPGQGPVIANNGIITVAVQAADLDDQNYIWYRVDVVTMAQFVQDGPLGGYQDDSEAFKLFEGLTLEVGESESSVIRDLGKPAPRKCEPKVQSCTFGQTWLVGIADEDEAESIIVMGMGEGLTVNLP